MFSSFQTEDLDRLAMQRIAVVHPSQNEMPSWVKGYSANNVYPEFPPLMCDGRSLIAAWQPEAVENESILKANGIKSNWEYRKYLTQNAAQILRANFEAAANDVGYYVRGYEPGSSMFAPVQATMPAKHGAPVRYRSILEPEVEFGRMESDLKANYMTREQMQSRMVSPVLTQDQLRKMNVNIV